MTILYDHEILTAPGPLECEYSAADRPKEVTSFLEKHAGSRPEQVCGAYIHSMAMSAIEELQTGTAKVCTVTPAT